MQECKERKKPVSLVASWEGNGVDGFKNSHIGGLWERSCRELKFNISQVRATDSHRRTQLSQILIKNSCVCVSAHRQASPLWIENWMGNEPSSMQLWNMYFLFFLPPFHLVCSLFLSVFVLPHQFVYLFLSLTLLRSLLPFLPVGRKQRESHQYKQARVAIWGRFVCSGTGNVIQPLLSTC